MAFSALVNLFMAITVVGHHHCHCMPLAPLTQCKGHMPSPLKNHQLAQTHGVLPLSCAFSNLGKSPPQYYDELLLVLVLLFLFFSFKKVTNDDKLELIDVVLAFIFHCFFNVVVMCQRKLGAHEHCHCHASFFDKS